MCRWRFVFTAAHWCARRTCDCCGASWKAGRLAPLPESGASPCERLAPDDQLTGVSVELIEVVTNILSVLVAETVGIATKRGRPVSFHDRVMPPAVIDH